MGKLYSLSFSSVVRHAFSSITFGDIFFENGDRYEGEILGSMPQGKGTMHYKDGTYLEGKWVDGNIEKEKTT